MQVPLFKILMDHKEPNHTVPSPITRPMPTQPPGSRAGEIPGVNTNITLSSTKGVYCLYMYNVPDHIETSTTPPPHLPGNPRAFDYPLCPGSGEVDLCLRGV